MNTLLEVPVWAVAAAGVLVLALGIVIACLTDTLKTVRRQRDDYYGEWLHADNLLNSVQEAARDSTRELRKQIAILTPPVVPEEVKKMREELEEMIHDLNEDEEEQASEAPSGTAD